jgi:hypothetical protein
MRGRPHSPPQQRRLAALYFNIHCVALGITFEGAEFDVAMCDTKLYALYRVVVSPNRIAPLRADYQSGAVARQAVTTRPPH